jgi:WD40 repeat protein/tRNA A-37 threonylcarbamoyl transferase component Bud32
LPVVDPRRYAITGELAHGGIGRVLRARDMQLGRPVALKELLEPSRGTEARFLTEALVTARLQHPSIVPIYEAGRWPGGEPFYAMKLVSGRSLADILSERRTLEERLALLPHVLAVAEAIAYAHSERIIHRDLKPANVLVGAFGETVVIDWGLAKELGREEGAEAGEGSGTAGTGDGGMTQVGMVMGTPAYMPPEQAAGLPVDERADVYALGAILYHLLAGAQPYDGGSSEQVLQRVTQGPPVPLAQRQEGVAPELLAIVAKAMAREPAERYATARELAEDLRRFQTGQIVAAHRYSRVERVRRLVRRYRAPLAVAAVALLLLAAGGVVSVLHILAERDRAEQERARAEDAQRQAQAQADELILLYARDAVDRDPNEAISWLRRLSLGFQGWSAARTLAADAQAHGFATVLQGHTSSINSLRFTRDGRHLLSASDDHTLRVWDWERGVGRVFSGHGDEAWRILVPPEGRHFYSSSKDGTVRVWDWDTGESQILATLEGAVEGVGLSADGRRLVAGGWDGGLLHVLELDTGRVKTLPTGLPGMQELALSPDGRYVLGRGNRTLRGLQADLERGTVELQEEGDQMVGVAFSPDGELGVAGVTRGGRKALGLWEPRQGKFRLLGEDLGFLYAFAFTRDGRRLASGSLDGTVRLWELATGENRLMGKHEGRVHSVAVSPDGRYVASGGDDRLVRLWDVSTGQERTLRGFSGGVLTLTFSPDGQRLAAGSSGGTLRVFPVAAETHRLLMTAPAPLLDMVLSPDGRLLAAVDKEGTLRLVEVDSGASRELSRMPQAPGCHGGPLKFSPEGRWLAAGGCAGQVHLWEVGGGWGAHLLEGHARAVRVLAFSADGRWLASADEGGEVRLWEPASGPGRRLGAHAQRVHGLVFTRDGRRLASASADKTVRLWEVESGQAQVLSAHEDEVTSVLFPPEGGRLISGAMDHTFRLWEGETGQSQRVDASGGGVLEMLLSPGGEVLVTRSYKDNTVRLWDARTGQARGRFFGHNEGVLDMALSPEGTRLASASADKTVRLWDLARGESRVLRGHGAAVRRVAFLPDGRSLVSAGADGTVRLWPDALPLEPEALRAWMEAVPESGPRPSAPRW